MTVCYSCKNELPERGLHCPNCGTRTKCGQCRSLLEPGDQFCVDCGAAVDSPGQSNGSSQSEKSDGNFNVITYNEDTRSRSFNAKLSDKAFEKGSDVLGFFLANRMENPVRRVRQPNSGDDALDVQGNLPGIDEDTIEMGPVNLSQLSAQKSLPAGSEGSLLSNIFRSSGDSFRLINTRLKQKNKSDFVARVTVLFLYAHKIAERNFVPRDDIRKLLEDAKVYDGNARNWLGGNDYISREGSDIELSVPGEEFAKEVLIQFADPNIDTPWAVGTKGKSRKGAKGEDTSGIEGKTNRNRKAKGSGYRSQITKLFEDGFFKDAKTNTATKDELTKRGYKFEMRRINETLVRLTKKGTLMREQSEAGEWVYKNNEH